MKIPARYRRLVTIIADGINDPLRFGDTPLVTLYFKIQRELERLGETFDKNFWTIDFLWEWWKIAGGREWEWRKDHLPARECEKKRRDCAEIMVDSYIAYCNA